MVIVLLGLLAALAVPRFVDLSAEAERAMVQAQAAALISNDTINVAACKAGSAACVDITVSGTAACQLAMASFLPELDLQTYSVQNIPSNTPPEQWSDGLGENEALFWVTRYLVTPPSESWLAQGWNVRQPCVLSRSNNG